VLAALGPRMLELAAKRTRGALDESDLAGGGSDRLVDALTAFGDVDAVTTLAPAML
jgi:hypothetical protein